MAQETQYIYGQGSEFEYQRLVRQGALYEPFTRSAFVRAGIKPGMRILDVGCGAGEVARIVADMLGGSGQVVAIDTDAAALEFARKRLSEANIEFRQATIEAFSDASSFDAVVGRFILMHLKDPVAALRALASQLKPGGIVCFVEPWHGIGMSHPRVEAFHTFMEGGYQALRAAGAHLEMGARLYGDFIAAGLPAPEVVSEPSLGFGGNAPFFDLLLDSARSGIRAMMPDETQRKAVIAQLEALAVRMREEAEAKKATMLLMINVAAWSRKP
jgi:SAM-dependent methyltransferase